MRLVICDRVDNGAAQHVEGIVFGVVDLQDPESLSDILADKLLVGGRFGFLDAAAITAIGFGSDIADVSSGS
jgi:hypothetical protein